MPIKNQVYSYRIINGQKYHNAGDCFTEEEKNSLKSQLKKEGWKVKVEF